MIISSPRLAVFPGTFDPLTLGHVDLVLRALPLFDEIHLAIGLHAGKQPMFSIEHRMQWIRETFAAYPTVKTHTYEGLTVHFCRQIGARFLVRGIRNTQDFEYEKAIADMNRTQAPEIETIFLSCSPVYTSLSSTLVRDILRHGGDLNGLLPEAVRF